MPTNDPTIKINKFLGINNRGRGEELKPGELRKAQNVDLTNTNKLRQRPGYELLQSGKRHSLWSAFGDTVGYVVQGDTLYSVDEDGTEVTLQSGFTLDARMSFAEVNSDIYFSNGYEKGIIQDGAVENWGLPVPQAPTVETGAGALPAGDYQVCITYANAAGEESGACEAQLVTLLETAGIYVSDIVYLGDAVEARVYITQLNGDIFYEAERTVTSLASVLNGIYGAPLRTQHITPPEPASIVRYYNGRIYMAVGKVIWYTEALAYGQVRRAANFFYFSEDVSMMEFVDGGMVVSADQTYFLAGEDAPQMKLKKASSSKALWYTGMNVDASDFGEGEGQGTMAVWMSDRGFAVAFPTGEVQLLSEKKVSFPVSREGAMAFVKRDGLLQFLSTLKEPIDDVQTFAMGDRVTVEVRRNGVVI